MNPPLYIGTSGWSYAEWRSGFYRGVRQADWLKHCAERFSALEANATFYRHLPERVLGHWQDATPATFRFAVKGHRFFTHQARLRVTEEDIRRERGHLAGLGDKLAAVLWQLPNSLPCDMDRLECFVEALAGWQETRHAVEFRHPSWFTAEVADCLAAHRLAVCQSDAADWALWDVVTTDMVYLRLHGHARTYCSGYDAPALERWADKLRRWQAEGRSVHVYFDNTAEGHASRNALQLMEILGLSGAGRIA